MQLSDNISLILQPLLPFSVSTIPEPLDPSLLFDIKLHFRSRPEHWKEVQKYRFENKIRYTRDAEIEYCKHELGILE